ncbi:hypothetical protein C4552_01550 [Candidatus Parcubacteria bacterium]|nr:MAG: hypothetical protein C4552_01550 [Candidatus Parcubacteria bacterium]
MQKKIAFAITALVCLALAQIGATLYASFATRLPNESFGANWIIRFYDLRVPVTALEWLIHAIGIGAVVTLAVTLRHRWGVGVFSSFVIAGGLGAVIVPLFFSAVHTLALGHYGPDDYLHKTLGDALTFLIFKVTMTQQAMIGHVITSALAAAFGVAFGRHLTMDASSGPGALGAIATRTLAVIRRLRKRDTTTVLKAAEA